MDVKYMERALELAKEAFDSDEVPVGCVIVLNDEIIGYGRNSRETDQKTFAHAEMIAIEMANIKVGSWRLEDAEMYITLEPCIMCAGAIIQARIKNLYIGCTESKSGAFGSICNIGKLEGLNHYPNVYDGIMHEESRVLLKSFFKQKRHKNKQK